ncbi:glutamyl-tRNA reductase [Thermoflavimicrobium daqui]|jgi:glutamyl-tRNA reductase|uniref:Glutamyl-tRNA reductase n=1 Tax=Thermoflavimicrobium daqui TaxID=2137476 RepID=A0A364K8R0_9BACL|nr:glutamyl-tRNA reductase [Thermoflavimicrobium daqui]RAL26683.1 glutamyl-tRNA reductase [Thermoflavimicrobium daqui]
MHTLVVGLNHKTAKVEIREKFAFSDRDLSLALRTLRDMKSILECVIVSTCNRMELYVVCDQLHTGEYYSKAFLESWFRIPREEFESNLYIKENETAVNHLFQVVAGLDSLVIGETQILGQVRSAFLTAQAEKTTGTIFNMLFKQAITLGKRVHTETEIGQNAVSVSYAAVELGKKMFESFRDKTIVLIGAGEMGELTAKHFYAAGATKVIVLNRTLAKAVEVAQQFQGIARSMEQLCESLQEADIVVSSTGSTKPILTKEVMEPIINKRRSPLFLIDIAVPRDIDSSVHELDQVFLYDIDDLHGIVDANITLREQEAQKVRVWIDKETRSFQEWLQMLGVVPLITALREKSLAVQEETMARIERKLPDLTEREKRVLRKHTKSIVNQLLRDPIVRIKELAATSQRDEALDLFVQIFSLEEHIQEKEIEQKAASSTLIKSLNNPALVDGKVSVTS